MDSFYQVVGEKLELDWREIIEESVHKCVADIDFLFPPFRSEIIDVGDGFEVCMRYGDHEVIYSEEAVGQDGDVTLVRSIKYGTLREAQFAIEDSLRRAVQGDCDWA